MKEPDPQLGLPAAQPKNRAGAWAAAAVVLGVGGLLIGVVATGRVRSLEDEVAELRAELDERSVQVVESEPLTTISRVETPATSTTRAPSLPLDVGDAEAQITSAFQTVYDGSLSRFDRLQSIDDSTGVDAGLLALMTGPDGEAAATSKAQVERIEFTSSSRATVTYTISLVDLPPQRGLVGEARLEDGSGWKVVRGTVCRDLGTYGTPCA